MTAVLGVLDDVDHARRDGRSPDTDQRAPLPRPYRFSFHLMPPVSDRGTVICAVTSVDMKAKMVKIEMETRRASDLATTKRRRSDAAPLCHWLLWPSNGGKWTRVEYQVHVDPGGSLPTSIINTVSGNRITPSLAAKAGGETQVPRIRAKAAQMPEYKEVLPLFCRG
ncbi:MAG: hypothetical protein U0787_07010 [Polyangia bacterium]